MPASKAKKLSSLFHSAIRTSSAAEDVALKQYVASIDTSSRSSSQATTKCLVKAPKNDKHSSSRAHSYLAIESLNLQSEPLFEDSAKQLSGAISSILCGDSDSDLVNSQATNCEKPFGRVLDIPWLSNLPNNNISFHRKKISRERKQKWVYKKTQTNRFDQLVKICGEKLGTYDTIEVLGKLGRETGLKEYNALIALCIDEARKTEDEEVSLQQLYKAYQFFKSMRELGFQIEEETYGPFLMYLINMCMVQEFHLFCELIRDENTDSVSRLAYYEMLLWVRVDDGDKIQELCNYIASDDGGDKSKLQENYLLALCESNREKELSLLLETFDITGVSSVYCLENIFKSLGRLLLESFAEKFILALKTCDIGVGNISKFIYDYVISMPNLVVEDVILKFQGLHAALEVAPSAMPYEKLVRYCCNSLKVHEALKIVDQIFEADLAISLETFYFILNACEKSCEYNLVYQIYSMICRHNLKPNNEIFRSMINICVKMKDFEGAYGMISDLEKLNLMPTASMYNCIMAGYYREKNIHGALMALKKMEDADVKPDPQTFSFLIANCGCEEDIIKYYEELRHSGVKFTKHVFMALINAYAACGQFKKAKQIVLDKDVPLKSLNEIKSVLVSALASHGQMLDALNIYEEIKPAECNVDPKAIICLIEHLQSDGELGRLLQLLEELNDPEHWVDGCFRVILYCVRQNHLSSAVDLLRQLKDKFCNDKVAIDVIFDEVFCQIAEIEHADLQVGLDLLRVMKEEFGLLPSRKSLDFLLNACVNAKDLQSAFFIWKEYQIAGLPYNILSFLRMYQALLASGDHKTATNILKKMPKDDPHVCCIIKACQRTYMKSTSAKGKTKEKVGDGKQLTPLDIY